MSLQRKEIRNEVVDILKRHRIVDPKNIKANRSIAYEASELPAISVYSDSEEIVERSQAPREGRRELNLRIEVLTRASRDFKASDELDDLLEKIEHRLTNDDTLKTETVNGVKCATADDIILQRIEFDQEGENIAKPIHAAQMSWLVKYRDFFPRDDSDRESGDFLLVHADWDFAPADGEIEAEDNVDIPQV